jgi:hypothetical protein
MAGGYKKLVASDNPKPFKKGQSGNPNGRPPNLDTIIDKLFHDGEDIETMLQQGMKLAKKGDLSWSRELLDRIYGKVRQDLNVSGGVTLIFDKEDAKA